MALDPITIKKIEDFVYSKPRSVQEIAEHINKNWRTADRYIEEIINNYGTLSTRVFREGTRGALKIVYWSSVDKISNSVFQEKLEQDIFNSKKKEDFSAFDIFQHVSDKDKKVDIEKSNDENQTNLENFSDILKRTEKNIQMFSGNLSFINLKNKNTDIFKVFEELVKKNITIKILCRVDLEGKNNIEKLLSLNFKYKKELIEIKHNENPIRGFIVDNKLIRIKEVKEPTGKIHELDKKIFIFYTIKNKDWSEWLSKIFWKIFSSSIDANKRLIEINKLRV